MTAQFGRTVTLGTLRTVSAVGGGVEPVSAPTGTYRRFRPDQVSALYAFRDGAWVLSSVSITGPGIRRDGTESDAGRGGHGWSCEPGGNRDGMPEWVRQWAAERARALVDSGALPPGYVS